MVLLMFALNISALPSSVSVKCLMRTRNNADGNKLVIFSSIALYYGDTYIITQKAKLYNCPYTLIHTHPFWVVFYILQLICKVQKFSKRFGHKYREVAQGSEIALLTSRSMNKHTVSTPGSDHTAR